MKSIQIQTSELRFHALTSGEPGKPLVLFLHGFPESSYSWRGQLSSTLLSDSFYLVAPDLRGYGLSDRPVGKKHYSIEKLEQDVQALIQALGYQECDLVGHDWGGAIAWAFADSRPQSVRKLAILNCPHPKLFARAFGTNPTQLFRSWYMFFFQLPWLPEWWLGRQRARNIRRAFVGMTTRRDLFTPEVLDHFAENALRPGALTAMVNYYRNLFSPRVLFRKWKKLPMAGLVIWGEQDRAIGSELLMGTETLIPDLKVVRIPQASHWVQQDAPEQVTEILAEFLKK